MIAGAVELVTIPWVDELLVIAEPISLLVVAWLDELLITLRLVEPPRLAVLLCVLLVVT